MQKVREGVSISEESMEDSREKTRVTRTCTQDRGGRPEVGNFLSNSIFIS